MPQLTLYLLLILGCHDAWFNCKFSCIFNPIISDFLSLQVLWKPSEGSAWPRSRRLRERNLGLSGGAIEVTVLSQHHASSFYVKIFACSDQKKNGFPCCWYRSMQTRVTTAETPVVSCWEIVPFAHYYCLRFLSVWRPRTRRLKWKASHLRRNRLSTVCMCMYFLRQLVKNNLEWRVCYAVL